jgi:hypothetical protein
VNDFWEMLAAARICCLPSLVFLGGLTLVFLAALYNEVRGVLLAKCVRSSSAMVDAAVEAQVLPPSIGVQIAQAIPKRHKTHD